MQNSAWTALRRNRAVLLPQIGHPLPIFLGPDSLLLAFLGPGYFSFDLLRRVLF